MTEHRRPVAILTRSLAGGGAERVATIIANHIHRQDSPVDLVLQYEEGPYLQELEPGIQRVVLNRRVRYGLPALVSYLRRRQPRALLSFLTEPNALAVVGWRLSRLEGVLAVSERSSISGARRGRLMAIKVLYPLADCVVAVSEGMRSELVELGLPEKKVVAIPNPIHPDIALVEKLTRAPNPDVSLILGVGRLSPEKDYMTLIRAFELVQRERPARLIILGEGPEREKLMELVAELDLEEKVTLPGFVSPPWTFMKSASVLALSSIWEGWPNVLVEAMALGTPVVSTDCPTGPREILESGQYGRLVPMGNPEAMADALIKTLIDPPDAQLLRSHTSQWSTPTVVDRYLDVLEQSARPILQ